MQRIVVICLFGLAIGCLLIFDLGSYFTLDGLKAQQAAVADIYETDPLTVILLFFLLYVALTAVSFPGAAIMTMAAGAIFGLFFGTIIASLASTLGATLAFLASRTVLRDWVQARFGDRLKAINEGVERDGAFYLFSLRLVPIFPFFLINLLMGLTPIRTVRRQNIWRSSRRRLAECGHRLGVGFRRRACGVASADVRWSVA